MTATCTDSLFNKFMENIIHELSTNSDASVTRTYIQCIGTTSRHSGHRVGSHLDKLMPLLTGFCLRADEHGDEHGDELREYCIQAFEGLVRRCPKEVTGELASRFSKRTSRRFLRRLPKRFEATMVVLVPVTLFRVLFYVVVSTGRSTA